MSCAAVADALALENSPCQVSVDVRQALFEESVSEPVSDGAADTGGSVALPEEETLRFRRPSTDSSSAFNRQLVSLRRLGVRIAICSDPEG